MCVPDELLRVVARGSTAIRGEIDIADRFQMRDPVIEHIGWTLKADIDSNLDRVSSVGGSRGMPREAAARCETVSASRSLRGCCSGTIAARCRCARSAAD